MKPLAVGVADLLRHPGSRRAERLEAVLDDLAITASRVPEGLPVVVDVRLEAVNDGIVATGTVEAPWVGDCRRCLQPVTGTLQVGVLEVFEEAPVEGETRKLDVDSVDLEPMAREVVLLDLPVAPLCRDDCAGLCPECGADRNTVDCGHALTRDEPRWAALDELRFDE